MMASMDTPRAIDKCEVLLWWWWHGGVALRIRALSRNYILRLRCRLSSYSCAGMRYSTRVAFSGGKTLDMLGYRCTQHGNKYRASLCDPMRWAPCKELHQQARGRPPWASRRDGITVTAQQWKAGKTATSPHGFHCADIDMYEVSPNNAIKVRGTMTFSLAL